MVRYIKQTGTLIQHIPRTGGSWVEEALGICEIRCSRWGKAQFGCYPRKHSLMNHYKRERLENVYYTAVFVRDPFALYESFWKFFRERGRVEKGAINNRWAWHPKQVALKYYSNDFNTWAFTMTQKEPGWLTRLYELYVGPEGGEFCDFIGRTETLCDDFCHLMSIIGFSDAIDKHRSELESKSPKNKSWVETPAWEETVKHYVRETECIAFRRFYGSETINRRLYNAQRLRFYYEAELAEKEAAKLVK